MDVHLPLKAEPECINNDISQISDSKIEVQTQTYDNFFVCRICNSGFYEKGFLENTSVLILVSITSVKYAVQDYQKNFI